MKKNKIPISNKDLRNYARWKNMRYLLFYLAFISFFGAAFVFFITRRYENAPPLKWWVYPLYVLAVLIGGWFMCFMNRFVSDRSVRGTILDTAFSRNYDRSLSRTGGFSLDFHTYVKLRIKTPDEKKRRVKIPLFDDGYDGYFKEGGTIIKFRGLNYPLCLESEREGAHICTVCGVRTFYREGKMINGEADAEITDGLIVCRSCGHTLIDCSDFEREK